MQIEVAEKSAPSATGCPTCGHNGALNFLQAPDRFHGKTKPYHLMLCPSCSLVWLDDPPKQEEMGEHYGADYDRSVSAAGEDLSRWRDRRKTLLQYKSGGAILDLGCSSGAFLQSMKGTPWQLYGIEMSAEVARKAEANSGARVFVGDILDAPFAPGTFDAITCFHVFEHIYQPKEVLAKVSEWLKPGGIFYTLMPNIHSAGARIFKSYWYALELPRHLNHFSPKSLKAVANTVGLEEVSITTGREVFIEASTRYIVDEVCRKLGVSRTPLAKASPPNIPFRVVRKAFRLTILPVLNKMVSIAGDGESIHAVFRRAPRCQG